MSQFFTDFSENPIQAGTPSGWTQRIKNAAGANSAIINGGAKGNVFKLNSSTGGSYVFGFNAVDNQQDVETLTLFRIVDTGQGGRFGINYNRYSGTTEATTKGYNTNFTQASSVLSVFVVEDSTGTINFANYAWSLNTWYYMRFRTIGTTIQAKIWAEGAAEPGTWLLSQTHAGPTVTNPYSGVGHFVQNSSIEYSQFSVGTGGDSAPIIQPKLSYTANAEIMYPPVPTSTPLGVFGGGYGGVGGYGDAYGMGVRSAFTVEALDYSANAFIELQKKLDYSANAFLVYQKRLDYSANAFIDKQYRADYTANAFILWQKSLSYTANASLERIESIGYTSNAELESYYFTASVDYTANAHIENTSAINYTANAFIEKQRDISYDSNAFVEWRKSLGYNANAFIDKQHQLPYAANAFIDRQRAIDYVANARIERIEQLSYTANASISNPIPDKQPQTWEDSSTQQPADWSADDKLPATWDESEESKSADWTNANESQPQQWLEDDKTPADWVGSDDKLPQVWDGDDTKLPSEWVDEDKTATTWSESNDKLPAEWQEGENTQPQQWSNDDNKKPADWSPIYYD